jgi:Bacterial conjugation TrbI-like protein
MRSAMRFFFPGKPGFILVLIALGLAVCWLVTNARNKQEAEAAKRQVQRELGKINAADSVDLSQAQKERLLSDRRLIPASSTAEPTPAIQTVPIPNAPARAALPSLVSFYAQVQATPVPSPTPTPEPQRTPRTWLPPGTFIPAILVNTVESSHINTPVLGEVTHDVCQNGNMIIPAGSLVSCFAASGAVRDRIEVAGQWLITYADGKHLRVHGIACDREADPTNQQFGIEDGSAGLQGELVESDHWANAKAFIALLMTAAVQSGTAAASSALSRDGGGVVLPDTTPVLAKYLDQLLNGETGDGRFVRVRASKEFYVFMTDTVFPAKRVVSGDEPAPDASASAPLESDPTLREAMKMERAIQNAAQPQEKQSEVPKFSY